MKNLSLILLLIFVTACTSNSSTSDTFNTKEIAVKDPTITSEVLNFENDSLSIKINLDKFNRHLLFGKAILKNKKEEVLSFNPNEITCINSGINGVLNLTLTDGLALKDPQNLSKEEIREMASKNQSKLAPLKNILLQPNSEKEFNAKITFLKPIADPKQTIIKKK